MILHISDRVCALHPGGGLHEFLNIASFRARQLSAIWPAKGEAYPGCQVCQGLFFTGWSNVLIYGVCMLEIWDSLGVVHGMGLHGIGTICYSTIQLPTWARHKVYVTVV